MIPQQSDQPTIEDGFFAQPLQPDVLAPWPQGYFMILYDIFIQFKSHVPICYSMYMYVQLLRLNDFHKAGSVEGAHNLSLLASDFSEAAL